MSHRWHGNLESESERSRKISAQPRLPETLVILGSTLTIVASAKVPSLEGTGNIAFVVAVVASSLPVVRRLSESPERRWMWATLLGSEWLTAIAGAFFGSLPYGTNPFAPPKINLVVGLGISFLAFIFAASMSAQILRQLTLDKVIDALAAGLAFSSLLGWLYLRRIVVPMVGFEDSFSRPTHAIVGLLAILILLCTSIGFMSFDAAGDRRMLMITSAAVTVSLGEVLAHHSVRLHLTSTGWLIDSCWIGAYVLLGAVATMDSQHLGGLKVPRSSTTFLAQSVKISVTGLIAAFVMVSSIIAQDPLIVGALALAALGSLLVRLLYSLYLERKQADALQKVAYTDPLTGLRNRRPAPRTESPRERRTAENLGGVVLIDLNNFKEVNDSLGHEAGDELLVELSRRFQKFIDIDSEIARLGGDEFSVTVWAGSPTDVMTFASSLEDLIRTPIEVRGFTLSLSASLGVAFRRSQSDSWEELLRQADIAMYRAKREHCGVKDYEESRDRRDPRQLLLLGQVGDAVLRGEIAVHFQPQIDVSSGRVHGCESLARWRSEDFGYVPPDQFVPLIEIQGLTVPFTKHVVRQSFSHLRDIDPGSLLNVSVNVTERDVANPEFPATLLSIVDECGRSPQTVTIEITESIFADQNPVIERCLRSLRESGIRISVDDFGTGFSSLSKLVDFPIDELKIDKKFVSEMLRNAKALAVVQATVSLAKNLSLLTVAEGVEDAETFEMLSELGVEVVQGYYFARPMPAERCQDFLETFDVSRSTVS